MRRNLTIFLLLALLAAPSTSWSVPSSAEHQVEIFLTSWCPYCKQAVAFFRDRGIPVRIYNVENDAFAARRKQSLDPRKGVPLVVIDGQVIYGFSPRAYTTALDD